MNVNEINEKEIKELRQTRGKQKAQLTRFQTFLNSSHDKIELEVRLNKIESVFEEFDRVQSRLEILDEKEEENRVEQETAFYQTISKAKTILLQGDSLQNQNTISNSNANSLISQADPIASLKLPTINLPSFSGNYADWTTFHDTFSQLIDKNTNLSSIQKFYYLRSCLQHDAARFIQSLEISNNNYSVAWESLVKRYENKRIIVNTHVRALFELPTIAKDSSITLRQLTDKVQHHLGALKNLKLPTDQWDVLMIHLITSKLDHFTNREWENSLDYDKLPTYDQLIQFLNKKCFTLETLSASSNKRQIERQAYNSSKYAGTNGKTKEFTLVTTDKTYDAFCPFCKDKHFLYNCQKFLILSIGEKYNEIKKLKLCVNCLRRGHVKSECKSGNCKRCNLNHNTLLHIDRHQPNISGTQVHTASSSEQNEQQNTSKNEAPVLTATTVQLEGDITEPDSNFQSQYTTLNNSNEVTPVHETNIPQGIHSANSHSTDNLVLLSTAQIVIYDKFDKPHVCKALLDSGSQSNLITLELCKKLQLSYEQTRIPITGINQRAMTITQKTSATIRERSTQVKHNLTFLVLPTITDRIPFTEFNKRSLQIPAGMTLADPDFNKPQKIDILLGANIFYELLCPNQIKLGKGMPLLQETTLGWIVTGSVNLNKYAKQKLVCNLAREISNEMLEDSLTKFWKTEEIPHKTIFTKEEQFCENYFNETTSRTSDGRFMVRLPFSKYIQDLGDSSSLALKRLFSVENRFKRNESLKNAYKDFMKRYESMNHMTFIENFNGSTNQPSYILPHHAVMKPSSTTTQCRVVFDGSALTSSGTSLNELLLVGPNIQDDLFAIVIRLRLHKYVLNADVKMMFRQILVHPDDRKFQQIIWRYEESEPIKLYNLNTVTYGTASASYLATKVLQQLSFDFEKNFPRTCAIIRHSFYMDDLLTSVDTIQEALEIYHEITGILNSANLPLRKWCSNEKLILDSILGSKENDDNLIQFHDSKELRTLGIAWNPKTDTFSYSVHINSEKQIITKRSVLATISRIFDPLGLIGPATIQAKLFMRQLWEEKLSWDEPLPLHMTDQWTSFLSQIHAINDINIDRHVICETPIGIELHGFSDASQKAYGSCIYLRSTNREGNIISKLLCAKSKVVPQGKHTLPRLELLAATLLANLMHTVKQTLDIQIQSISYYCDSTIVLAWLKIDPGKLKTFVANRVAKISELTNIDEWKHVKSEHNPADIISRGINPDQLYSQKIWWQGPTFLLDNSVYNHDTCHFDTTDSIPDIKPSTIFLTTTKEMPTLDIFYKFSSLTKLQRVVAYCIRFKRNALQKCKIKSNLTVEELDHSLTVLLRIAQGSEFSQEIRLCKSTRSLPTNSRLISLNPFIDEDGLIRVGGRIRHSNVAFSQKHPIILPKGHQLTRLIVEYEHSKHLHAGVQNLLSLIRLTYWPIDGKNLIKRVVKSCIKCFRVNPKPGKFLMGDLPSDRVIPSRPFSKCGVDYAGPILVKEGTLRRSKLVKAYISVFVCFSTRAIHIELVKDLTTDGFLNALKRFIARRGKPSTIFSDNGSNFVGANNHFIELYKLLADEGHKRKIENFLSLDSIKWSFIPAKSPHMGGIWEAAVKSTKSHLKRILGTASVTYEEMYTILTQIESCLNSRPLSPLSTDPNDYLPLTPAHFLIGDSLAAAPQSNVQDLKFNRLSRYQRMQQLFQQFWSRWSRDYLTHIQQRSKWKTTSMEPKIGDLVVLKEEQTPPLRWPMARIVQLHPGADKVTRVVSVKLPNGSIFKRSLAKICVLPLDVN